MGRPRKVTTTTVEELESQTAAETEETDEEEIRLSPEEQEIEEICSSPEFESAQVRIYRKPPGAIKMGFCETISMETFKAEGLEYVRSKYGGGDYRFDFTIGGRVKKQRPFSVDSSLKPAKDEIQPESRNGDRHNSSNQEQLWMQMLEMQRQHSEQMMLIVKGMFENRQPQRSTVQEVVSLLGAGAPLLEAFRNRTSPVKEALEVLKLAQEVRGDGGGGSATEDLIGTLAKTLGPAIITKLAASQATPSGAQTTPPLAGPSSPALTIGPPEKLEPAANGAAAEAPAEVQPNLDDPMFTKTIIRQYCREEFPKLARRSQRGTDVTLYFNELMADDLDQLDGRYLDAFEDLLKQPNWAEDLFGVKALPQPEWFNELRRLILDYCKPDEPTDTPHSTEASMATPRRRESEKSPSTEPLGTPNADSRGEGGSLAEPAATSKTQRGAVKK